MKKLALALVLLVIGCSASLQQDAQYALSATQIGCVIATELTDAPAVMQICGIDQSLAPLVQQYLDGKARARAAARSAADAGAAR